MEDNTNKTDEQIESSEVATEQGGEQGEQGIIPSQEQFSIDSGEWNKGVTLRPKQHTKPFYEMCAHAHAQMLAKNPDATKADATNSVLQELIAGVVEFQKLSEQVEALQNELSSAREQLLVASERSSELPEHGLILDPSEQEAKLLNIICRNRFADPGTRSTYKLDHEETPARMLIHLIRQADNLYNANGNFYTGFAKSMLK
jgi:hypothetical protein